METTTKGKAEMETGKMTPLQALGTVIRTLRIMNGYTRRKLSDKAGISEGSVKLIESGKFRPGVSTLLKILNVEGMIMERERLLTLVGHEIPAEIQIELSEDPLLHKGQAVATVVTCRFFIIPRDVDSRVVQFPTKKEE